jgi:hypothetical protein
MPAVNSKILQADYNDIRNKMVAILGNGSVNFGWGQQARINSSAVAEGTRVTINEWANLRYDVINAYKHINGVNPTTAQIAEGNTVRYTSNFTPDTGTLDVPQKQYDDWANDITNNRFTVAAGESVVTAAISQTKTTAWNGTVSCVIGFNFGSANEARYFFNSGGQIRISSSRTGGTTSAQNTAWSNLLTAVGTQTFGANNPGTGTAPSDGLNWYRCTSTFQTYYTGTASSPYGSNNIQLQARVTDVANNATGTAAYGEIRVVFTDGYTDPVVSIPPGRAFGPDSVPPADLVDGTLTVSCNLRYATGIMVPSSAVFTVALPVIGIGTISSDYTAPVGLATYSPSIFFDSMVFDLNNYLSEYRNPGFYFYQLDTGGRSVFPNTSGQDSYIADGLGDMFDDGNFTMPQGPFSFDSRYISASPSWPASGDFGIGYETAKTVQVYDGNFYYKTFGYGGGSNTSTGAYDPIISSTSATLGPASNRPESRPLTAFGYRTGSNQTIGWGKVGNLGADGLGSLSYDYVYFNQTVNTFQVWAFRRCVHSAGDPSVCDLYMLIGHPRWNSVYGGATAAANTDTNTGNSYLKMDGTTNVIAVTMLLSKNSGVEVTAAECQTVVNNMTARMKLFFYF